MTVKVRSGSRWVDATPKRYDGSRWVTPSELKRWNGSQWVTIWEASSVPGTPSAPTLGASNNQIVVSWSAPSTGGSPITHYDLRYRISGNWTQIDGLSGTSRTISSLTNGSEYEVQVRAANAKGDGAWSASARATPGAVPGKPARPTLEASNNQIIVTWTAPSSSSPITSYSVRYRRGTGAATRVDNLSGTSHTLDSLDNGHSYEIRVRASNAKGAGPWSDAVTAVPGAVPSKPSAPTLTASSGQIMVSWSAPTSNAGALTHYDLRHRRVGTSSWTQIDGISGTSRTVTGLTNGRSYEFQVRAANSIGDGAFSDSAMATPAGAPSAPSAPTLQTGNGQLTASWNEPSANGASITHYDLQYRISGSWTQIDTITSRSRIITGLTNGSSYQVRVRAVNRAGDGSWSSTATATPGAVPNAPAAPSLTSSNNQIAASWSAPGNNGAAITHYDLRYRAGSGSWTRIDNISGTSRTITGLTNGTSYEVQVRAANSRGDGPYSSSATATPGSVPAKPSAPSLIPSNGQIMVSWSAPSSTGGAITHYDLQYRRSGSWTRIDGITSRSRTITGLTNGSSYEVRVRAANAIGDGPWSNTTSATPTNRSYSATGAYSTHTVGGHVHIVWASNGTISFTGSYNVQFICVAGGGGGQGSWQDTRIGKSGVGGGGAGGAGGVLLSSSQSISDKSVTITVGAGGNRTTGQINGIPGRAQQGGNSSAAVASGSTFTAIGGGGGGATGGSGGSGGGGANDGSGGSGTSGQGHDGGDSDDHNPTGVYRVSGGGGGGGAGGAGGDGAGGGAAGAYTVTGGSAGTGKSMNLTGSNVTYAPGGRGGGTNNQSTVNVAGAGGPGGASVNNGNFGARAGRSGRNGLVVARFKSNGGSITVLS